MLSIKTKLFFYSIEGKVTIDFYGLQRSGDNQFDVNTKYIMKSKSRKSKLKMNQEEILKYEKAREDALIKPYACILLTYKSNFINPIHQELVL